MISHIDHLVLTVSDIERSVAFYSFGAQYGGRYLWRGAPRLALWQPEDQFAAPWQEPRNRALVGSGDLCLITRWSLDQVLAQLASLDVEIVEGPVIKSGACGPIESVYLLDPDRNLIEISRYR